MFRLMGFENMDTAYVIIRVLDGGELYMGMVRVKEDPTADTPVEAFLRAALAGEGAYVLHPNTSGLSAERAAHVQKVAFDALATGSACFTTGDPESVIVAAIHQANMYNRMYVKYWHWSDSTRSVTPPGVNERLIELAERIA